MVKFVGLIDFQIFTIKLLFGEIILEQISPCFGCYSRFFYLLYRPRRPNILSEILFGIMFCTVDFTKRFPKFNFSPLLQASWKHLVTISSL